MLVLVLYVWLLNLMGLGVGLFQLFQVLYWLIHYVFRAENFFVIGIEIVPIIFGAWALLLLNELNLKIFILQWNLVINMKDLILSPGAARHVRLSEREVRFLNYRARIDVIEQGLVLLFLFLGCVLLHDLDGFDVQKLNW